MAGQPKADAFHHAALIKEFLLPCGASTCLQVCHDELVILTAFVCIAVACRSMAALRRARGVSWQFLKSNPLLQQHHCRSRAVAVTGAMKLHKSEIYFTDRVVRETASQGNRIVYTVTGHKPHRSLAYENET
eukprot:scaffold141121_cov24-Tisochrysis_lutea.AAC.1